MVQAPAPASAHLASLVACLHTDPMGRVVARKGGLSQLMRWAGQCPQRVQDPPARIWGPPSPMTTSLAPDPSPGMVCALRWRALEGLWGEGREAGKVSICPGWRVLFAPHLGLLKGKGEPCWVAEGWELSGSHSQAGDPWGSQSPLPGKAQLASPPSLQEFSWQSFPTSPPGGSMCQRGHLPGPFEHFVTCSVF